MVWPILISVAVTPRISAADKAKGHANAASALTTLNLVTKRIDAPSPFIWARSNGGSGRCGSTTLSREHAMAALLTPTQMMRARAIPLFDHLVGAAEQRDRNGDAERLGGLEIDDEFHLGGLLDRHVGRLIARENPSGINTQQTPLFGRIAAIAHQAANAGKTRERTDGGARIPRGQCRKLFVPCGEIGLSTNH